MKLSYKKTGFITTLVCTIFVVGCSKSCSNLGDKKAETEAVQKDRPNYGGIAVKRVIKRDLSLGQGAELKNNQTAIYKFTAWIYDPKKPANRGVQIKGGTEETQETRIGSGNIIKGLNDGMIGMKVDGIRQLIIPPELAYGDQGMEPHVFPGAIILVDIELVGIK